ncbi:MAG: adenosylmethionine--8-amino-7-oxononanoate transaminase, partial [Desulfovibrionaceae bacterium]|nr:adenosylmethionine--8-amino-7-oxononanoate transaminase [Desulfovibrionaceae bacterium]
PDAQGKLQPPDPAVYSEAAPGADTRCLAQFAAACSPHLASRIEASSKNSEVCGENAPLTARDLAEGVTRAVREWAAAGTSGANTSEHCRNLILLEGAGGLLTPISESETLADLFTLLGWPVLLVAANRLGTVNHALLSLEALRSRNLPCPGFIMVETEESRNGLDREIRRDNPRITASLGKKPCLAELPYAPGLTAPNLTDREAAWDKIARKAAPALDALCARQNFQRKDIVFTDDADLLRFDREHLWHPYTSATRPIRVWEAAGGSGSRIRLKDGRELIDGMASWWCAIHGYRHPALMRALQAQAETMPHVMFGGLTHAPAARLGKKLLDMAPSSLEYVFFADSGSVAVEAALKMALQYWQAAGEKQRARIMTVRGGYHGDTLGAMSVCDPENGMHSLFSGILPAQIFAPRPECRFDAPYDPASERAFADTLAARADSVAAVILEPIVQGAGGMWFYHPDFLRGVHALCKRYGCLLILDEIATGFGRAGKLFACEHAGVYPDILCLGKGLSGGVLTLAATLATREVADGISRNGGVFMHGPTFMANPLACSVAEASLELIASGDWRMDVARLETGLRDNLAGCANKPGVADVRVLGAIGVVEMEREVNSERLQAFFVDQGVWIRPFGRLVYVMPPYVATDDDIAALCAAIHRALDQEAWR